MAESRWPKDSIIKIGFLDGDPALQQRVLTVANQWLTRTGARLTFERRNDPAKADIRISFLYQGSWSLLGRYAQRETDTSVPTMNFGWLAPGSGDAEVQRVVLHEFGHMMGLIHEHQNPQGGLHWKRDVIIKSLSGPPNKWSTEEIERNVLNQMDPRELIGTPFDSKSIMLYPFPAAWNENGIATQANLDLSSEDIAVDPTGGGVPSAQAKLILSQPGVEPSPTAEAIESFLRSLYRRAHDSQQRGEGFYVGRRLWLFCSGHGVGFSEEEDTGLLTADALPPDDLPHVAGRAWADVFRISAAFEEIVLFMDCCRTEANSVPLRRPALKKLKSDPPGRMAAAFPVAHSRPAFEVDDSGTSRGKFSLALESLLRDPPERPLTARRFLDLLCLRCPEADTYPPRAAKDDFELISGTSVAPARQPTVLVAHGETTQRLATNLAGALFPHALVREARRIPKEMNPAELEPIEDLVVTRNADKGQLEELVALVKPKRTVLFSEHAPDLSELPDVSFVPRAPAETVDVAASAAQIAEALAGFRGTLTAKAQEGLALVRIWDGRGRTVAQGYGAVTAQDLPVGRYRARASLGARYAEEEVSIARKEKTVLALPGLAAQLPVDSELAKLAPAEVAAPCRISVRLPLPSGERMLSLPQVAGWTTQVFSTGPGAADLSIRMIPPGHPRSARLTTDLLREALRLALSAPHWAAPTPSAAELAGDPIAALLAAALCLRNEKPNEELVQVAAKVLGDKDVDVMLLRGGATASHPPLLVLPWQHRLRAGQLRVEEGSIADGIVGRQYAAGPWLAWGTEAQGASDHWLTQVANAAWPGWDASPDPDLASETLEEASISLGSPAASVRAKTYKAPPVDRLVQHRRVAFVGASNDQLAAALVVAFIERGRQPWQQIDIWSLSDSMLSPMLSNGRTGARLLSARDRAEKQLKELLPVVAKGGSIRRYDGMKLGDRVYFASLWDWSEPDGFVHLSERNQTGDVRTSESEDLVWHGSVPSARFIEVTQAYEALCSAQGLPQVR